MSQQKKSEKLRIFSTNLKARLGWKGIQDNELAAKLGVEPSAVSNWKNAKNAARGRNLRKLVEILGLPDAGWLFREHAIYPGSEHATGELREGSQQDVIRRKCHAHIDQVLNDCREDLEQMTWTYVELRKRFPAMDVEELAKHHAEIEERERARRRAEDIKNDPLRRAPGRSQNHDLPPAGQK